MSLLGVLILIDLAVIVFAIFNAKDEIIKAIKDLNKNKE